MSVCSGGEGGESCFRFSARASFSKETLTCTNIIFLAEAYLRLAFLQLDLCIGAQISSQSEPTNAGRKRGAGGRATGTIHARVSNHAMLCSALRNI